MASEGMKQLRIVSNGTPEGTKVYTEDGEEITGIQDLRFNMSVHEYPTVELTIMGAIISASETKLEEVVFQCPGCGDTASHRCASWIGGERSTWEVDRV